MNIDHLSVEELMKLNGRIVDRIRYLQQLKTRAHLDRFEVGDRVFFQSDGRRIEGVVVRVNRKTVSIKTSDSQGTIHPRLLTKLGSALGLNPRLDLLTDIQEQPGSREAE